MTIKLVDEKKIHEIVKLENSTKVFARNLEAATMALKENIVTYGFLLENQDASIKTLHRVVCEGQHIIGLMIHTLDHIDTVIKEFEKA